MTAVWMAIGLIGQSLFGVRLVLQWVASERAGRTVVPKWYWRIGLVGGLFFLVDKLRLRLGFAHHLGFELFLGTGYRVALFVEQFLDPPNDLEVLRAVHVLPRLALARTQCRRRMLAKGAWRFSAPASDGIDADARGGSRDPAGGRHTAR